LRPPRHSPGAGNDRSQLMCAAQDQASASIQSHAQRGRPAPHTRLYRGRQRIPQRQQSLFLPGYFRVHVPCCSQFSRVLISLNQPTVRLLSPTKLFRWLRPERDPVSPPVRASTSIANQGRASKPRSKINYFNCFRLDQCGYYAAAAAALSFFVFCRSYGARSSHAIAISITASTHAPRIAAPVFER
jgi:hypothetical protein